ncbi:MAG: NACHT domain-containing protein, partial [Cyanobacteria bacterium P01_B01_bin.77]
MLIDQAFDLILKLTGAQETLLRSEGIIWLQRKLGLDPDHPPDNFEGVYTYALVDYTLDEAGNRCPNALLTFFRHAKIRDFIRLAYEECSVSKELQQDVTELLIGPTGQALNASGIDIVAEMQRFEALFNDVVKRTRTPKEVRQEKDIAQKFSRIERQMQQQQQALQASIEQTVKQLAAGQSAALPGTAEGTGFPLVSQVKAWFKALDYGEDSYTQSAAGHSEWMITIPARRGFDRILVRCVEGEASPGDVEELYAAVESQAADEGWLVYNRRISKTALSLLDKRQYRDVFSYTLDELIDQAADFSNYIEWLEKEVCDRGINTDYVQLACKKDDIDLTTQRKIGTSRYSDTEGGIEGYVDGWLEDDAKEHLSVLGEFGTGKTWFSFHYAWLALQKYKQTKAQGRRRSRLPLVIPLRDYAKALDVENVIANFFFNKHDIRITSKMFAQLNRMGKLLLIFDGFDEMAARVDKQAMINNFWELARVVGPGAKAILTCRTEHFPDAKQGRKLLSAELQASTKNLTGEPPEFEVLELEKFNESQIRDILSNKTEEVMVDRVMSNAKLMELAERPVMVDLILDALPKIESLDHVSDLNMSRVYLYAVTRRLEKDWQEERTFTSLADKLYFLCEVSWEMLQTDQMSLHFRAFPERLQRLFGDKVREQQELDHWHYDMMGQAMLVRDDEGNYRPAHRSLLEFFAAYKIVASLGVLELEFLEIAQRQSHINQRAEPKHYTWEQYFKRQCDVDNNPIPIPALQQFAQMNFDQLRSLMGKSKFAKAVLDLAHLMVSKETMREQLLPLVQQTKKLSHQDTGYVGGNTVQLMIKRDKYALKWADLSGTFLPEIDFSGASLRWGSLKHAHLTTPLLTKFLGQVQSVAFSPDGKLLALGDSKGTVQLWDTLTHRVLMIKQGHENWVYSVAFSPDGLTLASGSYDKTVKLWSVKDQSEIASLQGHENGVYSVAFSPDGLTLASGSGDKTVKLWSVKDQSEIASLQGHENWVSSVAFSPDGLTLASGSYDKTVKLWSVKDQS